MPAPWLTCFVTLLIVTCAACSPSSDTSTETPRPPVNDSDGRSASTPSELRRQSPFSLADRAAWRAALKWPAPCEEAFESSKAGDDGGLAIHELAPRVAIVEILCAVGAYQPSHVYLRYDEQSAPATATLLEFPVLTSDDGTTVETSVESEVWGESWFSPDAYEMSVLTLSRQVGDCGIWSRYALSGQQPVLTSASARLPCPASPGSPAQFTNGTAPAGWRSISVSK
jgi:hypothetical protein